MCMSCEQHNSGRCPQHRSRGPRPATRPVCASCITIARQGGLANYGELAVELARSGAHLCANARVDSNVVALLTRHRGTARLLGEVR